MVPNPKTVRQGCILLHSLFNLYCEYIIKMEGVGDISNIYQKGDMKNKHHKHIDDTTVLVESKDDMIELIK